MKNFKIKFLLCIIFTIVIELLIFNYSFISNLIVGNQSIVYKINDIEKVNWEKTELENKFISENDPMLIINNLNTYVNNILISSKLNKENPNIQIFYKDELSKQYNENDSTRGNLGFGNNKVIYLKKMVYGIRVDIGDEPGTELSDLEIIINPNQIDINPYRLSITLILLYFVLNYIWLRKQDIIKTLKSEKKMVLFVSLIIFIRLLFYFSLESYFVTPDSYDYIGISSIEFLKGNLNEIRTPLYPIFLDICKMIFGDRLQLEAAVAVQILLSSISLIFIYKSLKIVTKNESISIIFTFIYGTSITIMGWDKTILTESLALSGTSIYLFFILEYMNRPNTIMAILFSVFPLILVFLRPTFLVLYPMSIIFLILRYIFKKNEYRTILISLIGSVASLMIILYYVNAFHNQFGNYSLSNTLMRQELVLSVQEGYYLNYQDKDLIKKIEDSIENSSGDYLAGVNVIYQEYNKEQRKDFVTKTKSNNKVKYIKDKAGILINLSSVGFSNNAWHGFNKNDREFNQEYMGNTYYKVKDGFFGVIEKIIRKLIPNLKFIHVYFIIILECINILYYWIKKNEINWISLLWIIFFISTIGGTVAGTYAEWPRTSICVVPFAYISIGKYTNIFVEKIQKNMKKNKMLF